MSNKVIGRNKSDSTLNLFLLLKPLYCYFYYKLITKGMLPIA